MVPIGAKGHRQQVPGSLSLGGPLAGTPRRGRRAPRSADGRAGPRRGPGPARLQGPGPLTPPPPPAHPGALSRPGAGAPRSRGIGVARLDARGHGGGWGVAGPKEATRAPTCELTQRHLRGPGARAARPPAAGSARRVPARRMLTRRLATANGRAGQRGQRVSGAGTAGLGGRPGIPLSIPAGAPLPLPHRPCVCSRAPSVPCSGRSPKPGPLRSNHGNHYARQPCCVAGCSGP